MSDAERTIAVIRTARDKLTEACNQNCTCTSFVTQYQGCSCEKASAKKAAENEFWDIIKRL